MTGCSVNWVRRALLEQWGVFVVAVVVGFMGPFGTYLDSTVMERGAQWWKLLVGTYLIVRPLIALLRWIAHSAVLPTRVVVLTGVVATSLPLATLWRSVGQRAYSHLDGYSALVPFALLCGLAVLAVEIWAERVDDRMRLAEDKEPSEPPSSSVDKRAEAGCETGKGLRHLLSASFVGPIIALQSEDHYVRVHGPHGSELLLMRLRDAIAQLGDVSGEQVHRSWWVARQGIASAEPAGRGWIIRLQNGKTAPVARDSIQRLKRQGFLVASPQHQSRVDAT